MTIKKYQTNHVLIWWDEQMFCICISNRNMSNTWDLQDKSTIMYSAIQQKDITRFRVILHTTASLCRTVYCLRRSWNVLPPSYRWDLFHQGITSPFKCPTWVKALCSKDLFRVSLGTLCTFQENISFWPDTTRCFMMFVSSLHIQDTVKHKTSLYFEAEDLSASKRRDLSCQFVMTRSHCK